ncbi:propionate kinase, partial [Pseudomonas syringae pv. tagetis]
MLYHVCWLLVVSGGISIDLRELSASQAPEARDANGLFVRGVGPEIGSLSSSRGGVEARGFSGGCG